jgi:DNA polymerase-4
MTAADKSVKKIIHVDMDAFYASVEQRDNPELKGKPVVVGGTPEDRGVVAACSYEARRFGIHSAMATATAIKLCPQVVVLYPRFDAYEKVSSQIRSIFLEYTELVEPLSLDEAFLDVTENKKNMPVATEIAKEIRKRIFEKTGLTASAGVSYNKFLAKVASDFNKPDGLTVIPPAKAQQFIDRLDIGRFYGVGKVTEKHMLALGIRKGADLRKRSMQELTEEFGRSGEFFYNLSRGIDDRPVENEWIRKSVGKETTFRQDIEEKERMIETLEEISFELEEYAQKHNIMAKTITLKVKYFDFVQITRRRTIDAYVNDANTIMKNAAELLKNTEAEKKKVRLLGISLSNFEVEYRESSRDQLELDL